MAKKKNTLDQLDIIYDRVINDKFNYNFYSNRFCYCHKFQGEKIKLKTVYKPVLLDILHILRNIKDTDILKNLEKCYYLVEIYSPNNYRITIQNRYSNIFTIYNRENQFKTMLEGDDTIILRFESKELLIAYYNPIFARKIKIQSLYED